MEEDAGELEVAFATEGVFNFNIPGVRTKKGVHLLGSGSKKSPDGRVSKKLVVEVSVVTELDMMSSWMHAPS